MSGRARYAFEHPFTDLAYAVGVAATIAAGHVRTVDAGRGAWPSPASSPC